MGSPLIRLLVSTNKAVQSRIYLRHLRSTVAPSPAPVVLLLETFSLSILTALAYGAALARPKHLSVWLLYRGIVDLHAAHRHARLYRWLNRYIARLVRPCSLQLLTDSEPLAETYRTEFNRAVQALPVPHTPFSVARRARSR